MARTIRRIAISALLVSCGDPTARDADFGVPPRPSLFDPVDIANPPDPSPHGGSGMPQAPPVGGSGMPQPPPVGGSGMPQPPPTSSSGDPPPVCVTPATERVCPEELRRCTAEFTLAYSGETSVELRGSYRGAASWAKGDALVHTGARWRVTVPVPYGKEVEYKFVLNGTNWILDPANPRSLVTGGAANSFLPPTRCAEFTCDELEPPSDPLVFDWRDSVIYFAFVDRFFDSDASNNCSVGRVSTPANFQGGDWGGITQKIEAGYFSDLGVNTIWLTSPVQSTSNAGKGISDNHLYSGYHGYWPTEPDKTSSCYGSPEDLKRLIASAHKRGMKVLFDEVMVHVHQSSPLYAEHADWFWPFRLSDGRTCLCDDGGACPWTSAYKRCWFTDYLPHWNYQNAEARAYSVDRIIDRIRETGVDGLRLDAIKHVELSWLTELRSKIESKIVAQGSPPQRFYMVGETYDWENRDFIGSFVEPTTKLDGQFDFPLRQRLAEAVLMRTGSMADLARFMDGNDGYYGLTSVMSTFIGNHDLPRAIHLALDTPMWGYHGSDGRDRNWTLQPSAPTNRAPYERLANAFAVLFTNVGAPLVYYGDEIGLPGAGDPDNRRFMQWSGVKADQEYLRNRIKRLATIRAAHPALRRGHRATVLSDGDVWGYSMTWHDERLVVVVNRGDSDKSIARSTLLNSGSWEELVEGAAVRANNLVVPARQTRIFSPTTN